jgi:hypothetical protein
MLAISVSNSHHIHLSHYLNNLAGRQCEQAMEKEQLNQENV